MCCWCSTGSAGLNWNGTGPRWRPLAEAWAVLWQAGAWRQELIQLLLLLAERCERRLHPLPWALAAGAADSGGVVGGLLLGVAKALAV